MGRDKALIRDAGSGLLLWQRQLRILEELHPEEIFWSGPAREGVPTHLRIIEDSCPNAGPLAGINACLNATSSDLLVVLAIDLPQMTTSFLQNLLAACTQTCGMATKNGAYFEPLAAVYPKAAMAIAETQLKQGHNALKDFLGEAELRGMMKWIPLQEEDISLFKNVNYPGDL